jgi:hypothetical protein
MMKMWLIGGALLTGSMSGIAAEWSSLYVGEDTTIAVEKSTLRRNGPIVRGTVHITLTRPSPAANGKLYDALDDRMTIDCDRWQMMVTSSFLWYRGEYVGHWSSTAFQDIMPPDSPTEKAARRLCRTG